MELNREFIEEGLRVRELLDRMRFHEDFACMCDRLRFAVIRDRFAEDYRQLFGVHPDRREALKTILEPLRQGSAVPLVSIIEEFNRQASNGSGLAGGS